MLKYYGNKNDFVEKNVARKSGFVYVPTHNVETVK